LNYLNFKIKFYKDIRNQFGNTDFVSVAFIRVVSQITLREEAT